MPKSRPRRNAEDDAHCMPKMQPTAVVRCNVIVMPMVTLQSFWIARWPFDDAGFAERFGITAHSLADALDILCWSGRRFRAHLGHFCVVAIRTYADLVGRPGFRAHVKYNMGPIVCRGMWYPWITSQPPRPQALRMDQTMSLAPPPKLAGCLAVLECATIRLRLLGYAGEQDGMAPADAAEVAAPADAVHNLPYLIQHWESCDEELLREMLDDCDKRFPRGSSLLAAYEGAQIVPNGPFF